MQTLIMVKDGVKVVNLNRRKAIHEKCLNCSCWMPSEVTNCTFEDCHLWKFRSGRGTQDPRDRQDAIRSYCLWCMACQSREISKCVSRSCPLFYFRGKGLSRSEKIAPNLKNDYRQSIFETETGEGIPEYSMGDF